GDEVTSYHLEAAIAAAHANAPSVEATDWGQIVYLYDRLYELAPSPVVALNRAIAIGELHGPARGLAALQAIADRDRLAAYPFHQAARGELALRPGHRHARPACFPCRLGLA